MSLFHASQQWSRWSRRLASYSVSTFPSAPPRTGRAPFGAPGSPVSSAMRMIPRTVSAFRISRTSPSGSQDTCRPSPCGRLSRPRSIRQLRRPAPRGASAIPHSRGAGRVERDGGASFAPLNGMRSHRPPHGRFERRHPCPLSRWPRHKTLCRGMYGCIVGG